jgi:hypothetical protein
MSDTQRKLGEARRHLRRVLEQMEALWWQLLGIQLSLAEPPEKALEDVSDDWDAVTELRTVIECVLDDDLRPAFEDLRKVLRKTGEGES